MVSTQVPSLRIAQRLTTFLVALCFSELVSAVQKDIGLKFVTVPESRVVPPGDRVFFNCKTNLGKDEHIFWLHEGSPIDPRQRSDLRINGGQLSIKVRSSRRHRERQLGRYQCVGGFEHHFLTSEPASLSVAHLDKFPGPTATSEEGNDDDGAVQGPVAMEATVGNDLLLPCQPPPSNPPALLQWFREDGVVNTSSPYQMLINGQHLFLRNVSAEQSGLYTCHATNHLTGATVISPEPFNLTLHPEDDPHKPRLLYEPQTTYHPVIGSNLTIPCSASGSPKPTVYWTHHAFNAQPTFMDDSHGLLHLTNISQEDAGEYTCQIFNGRGRRILRKTLVTVFEPPRAYITAFRNEPHREGDPLELYCNVEGYPVPRTTWVFNGKKRQTAHKLEIVSLRLSDAGIYQCFAENDVSTSSAAVLLQVVPNMLNSTLPDRSNELDVNNNDNKQNKHHRSRKKKRPKIIAPLAPNVTQLSEDSVMVTWAMPNSSQNIEFFKVQYKDLGTRETRHKSHWYTTEGRIHHDIRSYEVAGLIEDHIYRFRVAVVVDSDNAVGPVSQRFHLEKKQNKGPTVIPYIQYILPISQTSLSIQWTIPPTTSEKKEKIEGYFIYFRDSASAAPYHKITIFGEETHSHIIENLEPGSQYDIKVRAFNFFGAGPYSPVQYERTKPDPNAKTRQRKRNGDKDRDEEAAKAAAVLSRTEGTSDKDATTYLILGSTLGALFVVLIAVCSVVTLVRRRKSSKKYSETNAEIHNKYQDTSRQISGMQFQAGQMVDDEGFEQYPVSGDQYTHASDESGVLESSFSATEQSGGFIGGMDNSNSSQCSTAMAQDSCRNLTYTQSLTPDIESLQEEYTDEPSGISWKRRRKSEEIL